MSLLSKILSKLKPKKIIPQTPEPEVKQVPEQKSTVKSLISGILEKLKPKKVKVPKSEKKPDYKPEPKKADIAREEYYQETQLPHNTGIEEPPKKSDIILQELEKRIATWEANFSDDDGGKRRASHLRSMIDQEISAYGRSKVAYSCEQAGYEIITQAGVYVYGSTQEKREQGLTMFTILLRGEILNSTDAKNIGNELDSVSDENDDLGFY